MIGRLEPQDVEMDDRLARTDCFRLPGWVRMWRLKERSGLRIWHFEVGAG